MLYNNKIVYYSAMFISTAVSLGGCYGNGTEIVKVGSSISDSKRIKLECEVAATREVPSAVAILRQPITTSPATATCGPDGYFVGNNGMPATGIKCNYTGGQVYGGGTYAVDGNLGLRQRVYLMCLEKNGFMAFTLPYCSPQQVNQFNAAYPDSISTQMIQQKTPLQNSCIMRSNFHGENFIWSP